MDITNKTILIAEDEQNNFRLIKKILEGVGANIIWAKDGEEAVHFCKTNNEIKLVIMDIRMPKLNGFEATTQIKQFKNNLPIVVQTAYANEFKKDELMRTNFDGFLSKPFTKNELIEIIQKLN